MVVDEKGKEIGRLGTVNPLLKKKGAVFQSRSGDVGCTIDASSVVLTSRKSGMLMFLRPGWLRISRTPEDMVSGCIVEMRTGSDEFDSGFAANHQDSQQGYQDTGFKLVREIQRRWLATQGASDHGE